MPLSNPAVVPIASATRAPASPGPDADPVPSPGDLWGHASLWLVFGSFVLFQGWRAVFDYPASTQVVLPGMGSLDVGTWAALINGLGGWLSLSAVVSLAQPGRFIRNLLRPLYAVDDEYIRKVFRNPVSFSLSLLIFVVTLLIAVANVAIELSSRHEVLACLPAGHGRGELVRGDRTAEDLRVRRGEPARLLLRGWKAREVLVIRDRYNLTTLDAVELQRTWLGFRVEPLPLTVARRSVAEQPGPRVILEKPSPFHLSIVSPLRFSARAVLWAVVTETAFIPGRLLVGEPEDGPEDPPDADPQVSLFFKDLWTARDRFAEWTVGHQHHVDSRGLSLHHPTSDYNNRIVFQDGTLLWDGGRRVAKTKEAFFVISKKSTLPSTERLLAATPPETDGTYEVVGLPADKAP